MKFYTVIKDAVSGASRWCCENLSLVSEQGKENWKGSLTACSPGAKVAMVPSVFPWAKSIYDLLQVLNTKVG